MFNKLQIRRFRKNERLDVVLEPITVFRGPSGSGKSSLVGALKWLTFNSPSGTDFIHWDHSSAMVRLIEGENGVARKRSKTENYYRRYCPSILVLNKGSNTSSQESHNRIVL